MYTHEYSKHGIIARFKELCPGAESNDYNVTAFAAYNNYERQIVHDCGGEREIYTKTFYNCHDDVVLVPAEFLTMLSPTAYKLYSAIYKQIAKEWVDMSFGVKATIASLSPGISSNNRVMAKAIKELKDKQIIIVKDINRQKHIYYINWENKVFRNCGIERWLKKEKPIYTEEAVIQWFIKHNPDVEVTQNKVTRFAKRHGYTLVNKIIDGHPYQFYVQTIN